MTKEQLNNRLKKIEIEADRFYNDYREQMDLLEGSQLGKVRNAQGSGLTMYDYWALGKQLEAWDVYEAMVNEAGNVNQLGKIPTIAHDVITAVQGVSILPIIASVQPIDDERGSVYFKQVRSADTRGSQTAEDVVVDPRQNVVTPEGYANNVLDVEVVAATVDATTNYSGTLTIFPVRAETLKLTTSIAGVEGLDVGPGENPANPNIGRIFGSGISGTINYLTGDWDIDFEANPGAGETVNFEYQQNFEASSDIPKISTYFDSKTIQARIYALKSTIGMLQSFGLSKRFGMMGEEEMAKDLVAEINKEVGGDAIRKLRLNAQGSTTFSLTLPGGVSRFEHELSWKKSLADAEAKLVGNAGRGTVNVLIVGREQAGLIQTLPGFVKLFDGTSLGAHVYGTIDGITVVRVTEDALLAAKEGVGLWKGLTPFEAACVWSPFMPLTVTGVLPETPNPLVSQRAAAVWAGVDSLVPNFSTKLDLVA